MMSTNLQISVLFVWRKLLFGLLLSLITVSSVVAAEASPLVSGPELGLPSIGRVLIGFLLVTIAAVGAAVLLRRLKPWVPLAGGNSGADVLLLSHRQLARNLHVHIVETQRQRFMVVSSPQQLVVTKLNQDAPHDELTAIQHG